MTPRSDSSLPLWVRTADVAAVVMAAVSLSVLVFGGFRTAYAGLEITAHDPVRPLLAVIAILAIRHVIRRTPSLGARLAGGLRTFWNADSVRAIGPVFLWSRAGVLLVATLSLSTFGYASSVQFRLSDDELMNLPARWDAGWYLGVATSGYEFDPTLEGQQNVVFFPAFPMLMRAAGVLVGGHATAVTDRDARFARLLWGGVLVNLAALAGAMGYLFRMVRAVSDRDTALAAVCFALAYPTAFVYNAPYTEGLFLLSSLATFYHFGRNGLLSATLWGTLAGLTRPNGFILAAPLVAIAFARSGPFRQLLPAVDRLNTREDRPQSLWRDLAAAVAPVAGTLIFSAYLYATWGDALLWRRLHSAWGRSYQGLQPLVEPLTAITEHGLFGYAALEGYELLQVLPVLLVLALSIPIARRLGLAYAMLTVFTVVPPLLAGGWLSMARITVTLFPIYVILAFVVSPRHRVGVLLLFTLLQALGASLFFTWRPFY